VQISLVNGATILSRSSLHFVGTRDQPIILEAMKHNGGELLVQAAAEKSKLEYVAYSGQSDHPFRLIPIT